MSDPAIRVENFKQYRIGAKQERYRRFTETAMDALTAPFRRLKSLGKPILPAEIVWALKDVSFAVKRLKAEGYWVRGVDLQAREFAPSAADEFALLDLREPDQARQAVAAATSGPLDEVYQLAADMGGMGFIHSAECQIMRNSALINIHMIDAAAQAGIPRYGMAVRIARFQNTYGPEGTWTGGREKAPAAICRKVASVASCVGGFSALFVGRSGTPSFSPSVCYTTIVKVIYQYFESHPGSVASCVGTFSALFVGRSGTPSFSPSVCYTTIVKVIYQYFKSHP